MTLEHPSARTDPDAPDGAGHPGDPFVFDFRPLDGPRPDQDQRWTTWLDVQALCRGPEPRPDWVVTSQAAIDTDLGVLKTGKEADAHLLHRGVPGAEAMGRDVPGRSVLMVAKRYRPAEHRDFHRATTYTEGRRTRNTRDTRALARGSAYGRQVAAGQWAQAEWEALVRLYRLGVPVPYPVQIDGTELLLEWIHVETDGERHTAPRLAQARPTQARLTQARGERDLLAHWWDQLREAVVLMGGAGLVHGDLSPYNVLAAGERIVVIDLPQVVDLVANPHGVDLLHRDCRTLARWFTARGLAVDGDALAAEALAAAW